MGQVGGHVRRLDHEPAFRRHERVAVAHANSGDEADDELRLSVAAFEPPEVDLNRQHSTKHGCAAY
jgi:hypothetical protein